MDKGRLVVLACAAATLIGINGATFAQPFRSMARSKVSMAARTPGNQPTDEPDYPEFKPTGNYMLETPFFNMEKFKKEETLGLAAVFGACFVLALLLGLVASTQRKDVDTTGAVKSQAPEVRYSSLPSSQTVNSLGKPVRVITN
mmetsp:Transcript_33725/g.72825  ORF Transcript_33725/g.72825 Transcript_33725/m.72825 type:complete len:144 (+) Transcript_33725:65-496(+)